MYKSMKDISLGVREVLLAGADIDITDSNGDTSLIFTVKFLQGNEDFLQHLLLWR